MWWCFFLAFGNLSEPVQLEELRVSVLLDAAQSEARVLFYYFDVGEGGLGRHFVLFDFETGEAMKLEDGRISMTTDNIVAQKGVFYVENSEQALAIAPDGRFLKKLRLGAFSGWEDGLALDAMEHQGDRVVALCSKPGTDDTFLALLDFENRQADIRPLRLPLMNRHIDHPEYGIVPFYGQFVRIEYHTTEIVLLDISLEPIRTLRPPHGPRQVEDRRTGRTKTVEVFTRPFVMTASGLSGKFLQTHDLEGNPLEESVPRGFLLTSEPELEIMDAIVIGSYNDKKLLWHRGDQTVTLAEPGSATTR